MIWIALGIKGIIIALFLLGIFFQVRDAVRRLVKGEYPHQDVSLHTKNKDIALIILEILLFGVIISFSWK